MYIYIYIHIASVTLLVSNLQVLQLSNAQGRSISFARVPFSYGKVNFIFSSTNFPAGKTRKQRFRNRNPAFSPSKTGRKLEVKITCSPRCFPHFFRPKVGKNLHIFFSPPLFHLNGLFCARNPCLVRCATISPPSAAANMAALGSGGTSTEGHRWGVALHREGAEHEAPGTGVG